MAPPLQWPHLTSGRISSYASTSYMRPCRRTPLLRTDRYTASSVTAKTTDEAVMILSLDRALTLAAPLSHRMTEWILTPSFSISSSSRSASVPRDPRPRYRAIWIACAFTHHQAVLVSRSVTLGSAVRAALITSSRC